MGCHTWFHELLEPQPSYEEIKKSVIDLYEKSRANTEAFLNGTIEKEYEFIWENYIREALQEIEVYNRQIRMIENNYCKSAVCVRYADDFMQKDEFGRGLHFDTTTNKFYVDLSGSHDNTSPKSEWYHDIFRIGGYPDEVLYSFDDTLKFLEVNEDKIQFGYIMCINPEEQDHQKRIWQEQERESYKIKVIEKLKEFWSKYPDGQIHFG